MLSIGRWYSRLFLLGVFLAFPLGATRLALRVFTIADGLGRNNVSCIVPDSKGFIWFCTTEGVSRYDGYQFLTYGVEQGLPNRVVDAVLETRAGAYLFATDTGISRLDVSKSPASRSRFTPILRQDGASISRVYSLREDHAGVVWATTIGGIYRVEGLSGAKPSLRFFSLGTDLAATSMVEDRNGAFWIGTSSGICRRWPDGTVEWYQRPGSKIPHELVHAMMIDRAGNLWVGSLNGLWKFEIPAGRGEPTLLRRYGTSDGMASARVHSLLESRRDGEIWVGTALALSELTTEENGVESFRNYGEDEGLSGRAVLSLGEDDQGALWAGVDHGLARIARGGFATFTDREGVGRESIIQLQDGGDDLWGASNETTAVVLRHWVNDRFIKTRPLFPRSIAYFGWGTGQIALRDHEGEWWIATGEGLCRFPKVRSIEQLATTPVRKLYTTADGLPTNEIFRLFEDSRGDIWITTLSSEGGWLSRWDRRTGKIHRYPRPETPGTPSAYAEDRQGNVWIAISNEVSTHRPSGLVRVREGALDPFLEAGAIGWISALYLDRAGRILAASTDGGLGQVAEPGADHVRFATYSTASPLSSSTVRCMAEDLSGNLYVGTPRGVDRIEPESRRVRHFGVGDGLTEGLPTSMIRDRYGRIWVATTLGLSMRIPSADFRAPPPRIYITGLSVNGESSNVAEPGVARIGGLELQPAQTQLRVDFVSVGGPAGESLQYQYKLEGIDSNWSAPSTQRGVSFARLTPGRFRFLVRPVVGNAPVDGATAEIDFQLLPPLWRRGWFVTSAMAILCALAWFAHRYDVSRRLELERMRLRIAGDLHDDLGASLTRMTILTELARRQTEPLDPEAGRALSRIAEMARGMVDALGDLVWAVDPRRDDMASTARRIRQYASDMLEPQGIAWNFETSPESLRLAPEQRRHVLLIFQEGLRNAARHSRCSNVDLGLARELDEYVVWVRDNGCGLPDPVPELGSGLLNLRARAEALGGTLSIVSSPGEGTDITVRFPAAASPGPLTRMIMLFREQPAMRSNGR